MGLIPLCPVVLPHFGRPLPSYEEETASYLHQITFLYTPPHWPYHEAYPESGAQRSHSRQPRPFQVSVKQRQNRVRAQEGFTKKQWKFIKNGRRKETLVMNKTRTIFVQQHLVNTHKLISCCCTYRYIHIFRGSFHLKSEQKCQTGWDFIRENFNPY